MPAGREPNVFLIGIEARKIQRYVLASPRLRDMVGASELVNQACESLPRQLMASVGIPDDGLRFGAAGRSWIVADSRSAAETFVRLWPVVVSLHAPGLDMPAACAEYDGTPDGEHAAIEAVRDSLRRRQSWPALETAEYAPLVERSPRTGGEAVDSGARGDELVDAVTLRQETAGRHPAAGGLAARLPNGVRFPTEIDRLVNEGGGIAVVHADGNGVGAVFSTRRESARNRGDSEVAAIAEFSRQLREANESAVGQAMESVILPARDGDEVPFRPLVVGGDDVTVLVRSDLAIPFVRAYVEAFEAATKKNLHEGTITVCAGVVVVRPNHPFRQAYALAESLCEHGKGVGRERCGKKQPSLLTFHRLNADSSVNYHEILETELKGRPAPGRTGNAVRLTAGPYSLHPHDLFPSLEALGKLTDALDQLPQGPRRRLISEMAFGSDDIALAWSRARALDTKLVRDVEASLEALHGSGEPVCKGVTPLLDAHNLLLFRSLRA
jgi:hypothetical protein